jgi:hypothetical protein
MLDAPMHRHVPELSGSHAPPSCGSLSAPCVELTVHEIGGFVALAPALEQLKRVGDSSFKDAKRLRVPGVPGGGGLCATFEEA